MRVLLDAVEGGDERAMLAVDIFCYRLAKALAGLAVALDEVHALVFTGGIGEHAVPVREKTAAYLCILGIELDADRNSRHGEKSNGLISRAGATLPVFVIATDEEKMIAIYVQQQLHL